MFYAARPVLGSEQSIVGRQEFLFCRGIKHCWRYLITAQVFTSSYGFVFRLWYCSFLKISLFRSTCNGTAAIFFRGGMFLLLGFELFSSSFFFFAFYSNFCFTH